MSDLSFWHLRGFCVPSGPRSPGGAGRWWSCWLRRSSWCLQSCSCWRRCSCSPLPVAGQATTEHNPKASTISEDQDRTSRFGSHDGFQTYDKLTNSTVFLIFFFLRIKLYNDAVLRGHFCLPACKIQSVTTKCKQTLCLWKPVIYTILTWGRRFMLQPHRQK